MHVHILYDNTALPDYTGDWGFACLIDGVEKVLFDTGADPEILAHNMERARVDASQIDQIVLSHDHWDHTGGLSYVLGVNDSAPVHMLASFSEETRAQVGNDERIVDAEEGAEISPGVFTTGEVWSEVRPEQAVVVPIDDGVLMVTGCAHPGVDALMERASAHGPIHGVLGGFHGFNRVDKLEGIPFLGACHCTQHADEIRRRYPDAFEEIHAGMVLEF